MIEDLLAKDYLPKSELVTPETKVERAKFPAVDAHNHLTEVGGSPEGIDVAGLVAMMDELNVRAIVNLSGGTGDALKRILAAFDEAYPGRFITYCTPDFTGVGSPGWTEQAAAQVLADARAGARGVKIFKELGLRYRDPQGNLVMPDDPRLSDLWEAAGEAGIPVTIHSADPRAFFRPLDRFNERWDELHAHPNWHFYGPEFPTFEALMETLYHTIEQHPRTNFITAHVGCYPENLGFVTQMMERYPNFYTDFSARIAELGRAPYSARAWFLRFPERILFGTDHTPSTAMFQTHFRFLESADEYFPYFHEANRQPPQGRWNIYGLFLPDEVLRKVYLENAQRLYRM